MKKNAEKSVRQYLSCPCAKVTVLEKSCLKKELKMKRLNKMMMAVAAMMSLSGCASSILQERVIARSDDLAGRPEWARIENTEYQCKFDKNGNLVKGKASSSAEQLLCSLGVKSYPASQDTNLRSLIRSADLDARANFVRAVKEKVLSYVEEAEEDHKISASEARQLASAASEATLQGAHVAKRYWEKKLTIDNEGENLQYEVMSLVYISQKDLRTSMEMSARKKGVGKRTSELLSKMSDKVLNDAADPEE